MLQGQLAAFQRATITLGWRWALERGKNIVSQARGVACEIVTPFDGSIINFCLRGLAIILHSFCNFIVVIKTP